MSDRHPWNIPGTRGGDPWSEDTEPEWAIYSGDDSPLVTELPSRESAEAGLRTARNTGDYGAEDAYVDRWPR